MEGATQMTVTRQEVIFDGTQTHVEAEQQEFDGQRWTRKHAEGTWEGNQTHKMIREMSKSGRGRIARKKRW